MSDVFFDTSRYPEEAAALGALEPPPGTRVFGIDLGHPADGIAALIAARRAGVTSAVFPILADPYEATLATIYRSIVASPDNEVRATQLDALACDGLMVNEIKPIDFASIPAPDWNAASLALRLADVVLMAAPGERARWDRLFKRTFRRCELLPATPATVSAQRDEGAVTVFAPELSTEDTAIYAALLAARRIPTHVVNRESASKSITTRVVLTPQWRPIRTRALAEAGYHVVAPDATSVSLCSSRIFGYTPSDHRSVLDAVDAAMSAPITLDGPLTTPSRVQQVMASESARSLDGPRVSIIVRTFDRPALLLRAIASIAKQTHRDIEIVVVNNGGEDVRGIVEGAANDRLVRYEAMPQRMHISAASNVGARAATGAYVGYLDDDDLLYADHCALTVDALERTKADLAFTLCLGEYAQMSGDSKHVLGYQLYLDRAFHPDDVYIANITPIHSIVHSRSLFDRFGYFDEKLPVTDDWELWLRAASGGARFLRIDRVTCEYSWRYDPNRGNMTVNHQRDFVEAYGEIAERYRGDVATRPSILGQQRHMYESQQQRAANAADPAKAASVVISTMSETMVPVTPVPDPS